QGHGGFLAVHPTERAVSPRKTRGPAVRPKTIAGIVFLLALAGLVAVGIQNGTCETTLSGWISLGVTGLRLGAIYSMIALGYTLVYGVLQLLNFAHSEIFMVGSFAGLYSLSGLFGITGASHPNG